MMVWISIGRRRERVDEQPGAEEAGEDQPDDGVLLQPGALADEEHGERCEAAGEKCADGVGQAEQKGAGDARHDRVAERVADQRPALEHQVGAEEGADGADQRADPDGVDHVAIAEGFEQVRHRAAARGRVGRPDAPVGCDICRAARGGAMPYARRRRQSGQRPNRARRLQRDQPRAGAFSAVRAGGSSAVGSAVGSADGSSPGSLARPASP